MSTPLTYEYAARRAVEKWTDEKFADFSRRLAELLSEAVPASYDNPLGQFPKHWEDVLSEIRQCAAANYQGQAETKLFSTMHKSMLDHLREDSNGSKKT